MKIFVVVDKNNFPGKAVNLQPSHKLKAKK